MGQQYPNVVHAFGSVLGSNGSKVSGAGFSSARTAKGDYNVTLDLAVDATECAILATIRGATSGVCRVVQTSDSVKRVLTFLVDGTTAADLDFDFLVLRGPF
jgi:hypothetical protein